MCARNTLWAEPHMHHVSFRALNSPKHCHHKYMRKPKSTKSLIQGQVARNGDAWLDNWPRRNEENYKISHQTLWGQKHKIPISQVQGKQQSERGPSSHLPENYTLTQWEQKPVACGFLVLGACQPAWLPLATLSCCLYQQHRFDS